MPSPFPGMNPYFESPRAWEMFHTQIVVTLGYALNRALPAGYFAKTEEMLFIHEPPAEHRRHFAQADVAAVVSGHAPGRAGGTAVAQADAAVAAPVRVIFPNVIEERHRYLSVVDKENRPAVAVVELLSPSNKPAGSHHDAYLSKRAQILKRTTHLVEIDLLRGGGRMPMEPTPAGDYLVAVARADERDVGVWPATLRAPLPTIPVPLRRGDGPVPLDLQAAVHAVHDDNSYARWLYDAGLDGVDPPLSPEDAAWAAELAATVRR